MRVLSLFDGISCGMVALERVGIPVERYVAFETDKYAIQVSSRNYPQIEHCGDVFLGDYAKYKGFDLLIGGSPCTFWSIAKRNRETTADGMGAELFMQYVRALKESGCRWFLYENNYSIHQNIKDFISEKLGVQPIMINSALVSAQSRKRCYWTNIPVEQPEDKGILLQDILEENALGMTDKNYCMTSSYNGAVFWNTLERKQRSMVAVPINTVDGKSHTLLASYYKTGENPFSGYDTDRVTRQRVAEPIRLGSIGEKCGQAQRIYSVRGKSVTIRANGGGQGAKTGLYRLDLPDGDYLIRKLTPLECERLQTLPDHYTEGVSNTQRYKCIGNGWTVDVIAHILRGIGSEPVIQPQTQLTFSEVFNWQGEKQ